MMQQLILGLFILCYLAWSIFTFRFVITGGKKTPGISLIGKLMWYHGNAVPWVMVSIVVITASILFSKIIADHFPCIW